MHLVTSALVVGTLAPDFEYFIRLTPNGRFGHTLLGSFLLTLPLALVVLWMFHAFVKVPVAMLLPEAVGRRLENHLDKFRFGGAARFLLIVASVLIGIATHLVWDSFTHPTTWLYRHWSFLGRSVRLPIVGETRYYKVFQHGSTIAGIGILLAWFANWYRTSEPSDQTLGKSPSPLRRAAIVAVITAVAFVGAVSRAVAGTGVPNGNLAFKKFVGQAVVTAIALVWWQLVVYGVLSSSNDSAKSKGPPTV